MLVVPKSWTGAYLPTRYQPRIYLLNLKVEVCFLEYLQLASAYRTYTRLEIFYREK